MLTQGDEASALFFGYAEVQTIGIPSEKVENVSAKFKLKLNLQVKLTQTYKIEIESETKSKRKFNINWGKAIKKELLDWTILML